MSFNNQNLAAGFSSLPSTVLPPPQSNLLWRGDHAFFSAVNASVILDDGTAYSFQDDWNRLPVIDSGAMGEEISRSPVDWTEDGLSRHLNFYFGPVTNIIHQKAGLAENWTLYEARVSTRSEEWASRYTTNTPGLLNGIDIQAPLNTLFHCDTVYMSYQVDPYQDCNGSTEQTRSTTSAATSSCTAATFQASDVYMAGFLQDTNYDPCRLEVYNPCRGNTQDGRTHCTATNGHVMCQTPAAAAAAAGNNNAWNLDQARETISSSSSSLAASVDLNSRYCGVRKPEQQVVGTAPPTSPPTFQSFNQDASSGVPRSFLGALSVFILGTVVAVAQHLF